MLKRRRLAALITGAILGVGALSGCEKLDAEEEAPAQLQDVAEDDAEDSPPPAEEPDSPNEAEDTEPDELDVDDGSSPDESSEPAEPDTSDTDAQIFEVLATEHCPIDIPAPILPHDVELEEPGDGVDVFCVVHVISKGDPVYLYEALTEQFRGVGAEQLEDNPSPDPQTPGELSIQSWQMDSDHEIIINVTNMSMTQNELIYVVRSTARHG